MSKDGQQLAFRLQAPGQRLDSALAREQPDYSRVQWQRFIREGHVMVDGQATKPSQRLTGGELVEAFIPTAVESTVIPEDIPLDIRYEDADMIVINKPAGMVVHPSLGHQSGTLVNALLAHCPDLAGVGGELRPGIVHRLDKDTSGLIVAAKHHNALRYLQNQFKNRTVTKVYTALVYGRISPEEAIVDAPIGRHPHYRKRMSVIAPKASSGRSEPFARPAQTTYRTVRNYKEYSLVECRPRTGRKHQIRVHLAYVGSPVVGDTLYTRRRKNLGLDRHFLHASELSIRRPSDESLIATSAELPPELQKVLAELDLSEG